MSVRPSGGDGCPMKTFLHVLMPWGGQDRTGLRMHTSFLIVCGWTAAVQVPLAVLQDMDTPCMKQCPLGSLSVSLSQIRLKPADKAFWLRWFLVLLPFLEPCRKATYSIGSAIGQKLRSTLMKTRLWICLSRWLVLTLRMSLSFKPLLIIQVDCIILRILPLISMATNGIPAKGVNVLLTIGCNHTSLSTARRGTGITGRAYASCT